ncbi:MAG: hypothetical protein IPK07_11875 [Deltaproteobacteria bacterium]|nr:hypothetical protein [Deltaproteobacteria bacterium]
MPTSRASTFVASLLLSVTFAFAAAPTPARAQGACADDSERICGHVKEGGGARIRCLQDHPRQLSPDCARQLDQMQDHANQVSRACSDDAARLCGNVESGKGRVVQCLAAHESQLTRDCRAEVSQAKSDVDDARERVQDAKHDAKEKLEDRKEDFERACSGDISRECRGVEPGHGNIVRCLQSHEGSLSPACRDAIR